jgi:tape measure domain-containing protein
MASAEAGAQASAGFNRAEAAAERMQRTLRNAAGVAAAAFGVASITQAASALVRVADGYANIDGKLRLATDSEMAYAAAKAETFAISQRTSTELAATVSLYSRLTAAFDGLAVPQARVAQLTETVNEALAISGATGVESASAVLQLSQAFGAGALRGEEFNAVNEAAPRLMQALATSLGVPRGELKALAEEGKLTAEVLLAAFSGEQAEQIAAEFAKVPITIERGWTQVRNATQRTLGELDKSFGASSGLAQSLVALSNNMNLVVDAVGALGVAVVANAGARLTTSFVAATTAAVAKRQAVVAAAAADQAAAIASVEHAAAQARDVTATLAAVQAARADAVATMQTAQTKVQAAQATIAATSAIGAQSAAIRANAIAQEQLTVAIAQRTAATTALATLGRQQAALEAQLAAAATAQVAANNAVAASQARLATASSAAAAATGVLSRAGGALFTMIGGWPTIAAGAAAAIYYLVTSIDRSAEAAEAAVAKAREERERWQQEAVEQRRKRRAENPDEIFGDIVRMERRIEEIRRRGGADGPSDSGAQLLATLTKDLRDLRQEYAAATGDVSRFSTTLSGQREDIGKFIDRLKQQVQSQREQIAATQGGAAAVAELQRNQLSAAAATDEQKQQIQALIATIGQNDAAIKRVTDAKRAERDVQKELNEQLAINRTLEAQNDAELLKAEQASIDRRNATDEARAAMAGLQADLDREAELIGMNAAEREIAIAVMQEEDRWRGILEAAQRKTIDLTEAEVLEQRDLALQMAATNAQRERENRIRRQLGTFGGRVDPNTGQVQAFNTLPELIGGAIAESINDGAEGFSRVLTRWSDAWDQAQKDGPAAQTSFVAETITQVADFASNVIGAFERNADAPLRAIAEVAAMIPGPVGDVARAVQAIDSLFGGRLLGTNYEVQRQGRSVAFGASGVTGNTFVTETRQRALFGGTARRTTTTALDAEAQAQLTAFFDQVAAAVGQAARALGAEVPALVAGAFREEFDKNGKLISQVSTVAGRTYTESFQQFQQRLTAESLLLVVGQFDSAVQQIAERWRADAAKLLDGAQFLLQAQAAIQQGEALLGEGSTLTQTADFVQDFARAGETLSQTFTRLQVSSKLLTEATDLMGVALDLSREEFIRFAADITDAAGGVERAAQLWQGYFETFYSAEERAARSVDNTASRRTEELADIGLAPEISMAEFRALFEEALPTLSAEAVVEWLEAADAIRQANAAQRAYAEALRAEADFLRDIGNAILEQDGSEFDQTLARIRDQTAGYIEQANALARSRGEEAASARDLAMIHRWAANEVRRAIEQLRGQARDVITQLGYNDLDAQIAELEGRSNGVYQSQVDGLNDVADAAANAFEEMQSAIADLNDYLEDMLLGDLSPLSPEEQLDEAQRRLNETAARALQGDASAVQQLPQLADAYLRLVRDRDASGADYRAEFERVRGLLQSVAGMDTGVAPPRDIQLVPSEELRALYAQRDQRAAEEEAQRRLALASDLATYLRDLAAASNESLFAVAERLGVDFDRFVGDLGGQAEASTAEAVAGLAAIANQLNVELSELGEELGLALGELADENSLLNDAFELALAGLPEEFRTQLEPALQDVENAASTEESAAALERLEDLTDALPEEFRLRLAPYLANIDAAPFEALNQLGLLSAVDANTAQAVTLLEQILVAVGGELADDDAPATAAGKALLSSPLEFVPTKLSDDIREGNRIIVDELAAMRRELEQLRREARENAQDQREATGNGAERTANAIAGAIDRQTAELTIRRQAN